MAKKAKKEDFDPLLFEGIAHRGLHGNGKTENGLGAFQAAVDAHCAIELDVHLTKDGDLIVCHDDNLKRTTGKEGVIEELDAITIRKDYRLLDGGVVPTFDEVLDLVKEKVPVVVELKVHEGNYRPLAKKTLEKLGRIQNKKSITLISFDPRALLCCKKCAFTRGLLIGSGDAWTYRFRRHFEYLDVEDRLLLTPKYQKERAKGRMMNVWTIHTPEQLEAVCKKADMITFQEISLQSVRASL